MSGERCRVLAPAGWGERGATGVGRTASTSLPVELCGKLPTAAGDRRLSSKILI